MNKKTKKILAITAICLVVLLSGLYFTNLLGIIGMCKPGYTSDYSDAIESYYCYKSCEPGEKPGFMGLHPAMRKCYTPYEDADTPCKTGAECQGRCLVNTSDPVTKKCYEDAGYTFEGCEEKVAGYCGDGYGGSAAFITKEGKIVMIMVD